MNIGGRFTELQTPRKSALIAYVCAGDPTPCGIRTIVHALARDDADVIVDSGVYIT